MTRLTESEIQDLDVGNGWIIEADRIREQLEWARENRHASCYFQRWDRDDKTVICIVDLFHVDYPTKSVTNDADFVVTMIHKIHGNVPFIYRDTNGDWDELRHREGYFACFRSLNTKDRETAIETVLALHEQDALRQEDRKAS